MTNDETAFLAQVALGWFTVNPDGSIWRNVEWRGGGVATMAWVTPRPAARTKSGPFGYPRIMFHHLGKRLRVAVHRIVWIHFNKKAIPSALEVNHKDCNKQNHHPDNLELVTRPENVLHAIRTKGRRPKAQDGAENGQAKLTEDQVSEIRALWASRSISQREIAARFGNLSQSTISAIVTRKSWEHVA